MLNLLVGASSLDGVETALTSTAADVTGTMGKVLVVALSVFALNWGVRKVLSFFKTATN